MTTKTTKATKATKVFIDSDVTTLAPLEEHVAELYNQHIMPMINSAMAAKWGNGIIPIPIIATVEDQGKRACMGSFTPEAYVDSHDKHYAQLKIVAESFNRPIYGATGILETMVHEGIHAAGEQRFQFTNDDHDRNCTKDGSHRATGNGDNSHFETIAMAAGLIVTKGTKSMNVTEASDKLQEWFHTLPIKEELFDIVRLQQEKKTKSKSNHIKYACECSSFRSTKEINATCNDCNSDFVAAK